MKEFNRGLGVWLSGKMHNKHEALLLIPRNTIKSKNNRRKKNH
jgi:hypothetical protein